MSLQNSLCSKMCEQRREVNNRGKQLNENKLSEDVKDNEHKHELESSQPVHSEINVNVDLVSKNLHDHLSEIFKYSRSQSQHSTEKLSSEEEQKEQKEQKEQNEQKEELVEHVKEKQHTGLDRWKKMIEERKKFEHKKK